MTKTPTRTLVITLPLLFLGTLQLTGCVRRDTAPPPPGGVYRSTSGGAQFDQSVSLIDEAGETTGNIAELSLRTTHRLKEDPSSIFVTAGSQGVFFSADDGQSWRRIPQPLPAVTAIVRLDNGILLASGTNADGEGIVTRSLNDADSWERVLTIPALFRQKRAIFQIIKPPPPPPVFVSSIVRDPFNPEQVYATTSTGDVLIGEQSGKLWRTFFRVEKAKRDPITNQAVASISRVIPSPHREGELFLVTTDGELVRLFNDEVNILPVPQNAGQVIDIEFIQQFPQSLLVGANRGAFVSTDAGESWEELRLPISTISPVRSIIVRVSPTNPSRILVAVDSILYRSEDGGKTFNTLALGLPNHLITDITIDPANAARVLLITTPVQT